MPADIDVRLEAIGAVDRLEADWRALEARSEHSFFQSWGWIGCWLRHLPPEFPVLRLEARERGMLVGLGLMVESRRRRRGLIASRAIHLHETGSKELDLTIEHNGILLDRRVESTARRACQLFLIEGIRHGRWDEVCLTGVPPGYEAGADAGAGTTTVCNHQRSYFVDLARLRREAREYPAALSRNTRSQLRRSLRYFAARGALELHVAGSAAEAHVFLDSLVALHEARWRARRQATRFPSPFVQRFHRALIDSRFAAGDIQLVRVAAGARTVGYLYNFVYGKRVYFYQSGLAYEPSPLCRPGLVCHALAIEHNLARGADVYDLLHSDDRYKRSLATHADERLQLVFQKRRLDFRLEQGLRGLKRRLAGAGSGGGRGNGLGRRARS